MSNTNVDRRTFMYAAGVTGATLLAGCSSSDGGGTSDDGTDDTAGDADGAAEDAGGNDERPVLDTEPDYDGWLEGANNYDETVDWTGRDAVTVAVGYESLAFDPAAIAISPGTTVTWEWTGEGGDHNVVSEGDGPLESELVNDEGHTYEYTFEESGTYPYQCDPHSTAGMKGAVYVD